MIFATNSQRILAKLINACHELEDALSQSRPAHPDDSIIPQAFRNQLSVVRDDLARVISSLDQNSH
jgi:hypothetical protein